MTEYAVYYMRPNFFREFIHGDKLPYFATLPTTHAYLRTIQAASLDEVYSHQQAHHWAEDWQATNALLARLELSHTSMSVGDVIEDTASGEYFVVAPVGFVPLPHVENPDELAEPYEEVDEYTELRKAALNHRGEP